MTVESILFLYTLIVCLCLKDLVRPSKWRVELGVWEVAFFPFPDEIVCSFFNFLFDIFWNSTNLAYVTQLGEDDLVCDYLLTLKESLSLFRVWIILLYLHLFCPIWIYRE